MRSGSWSGLGPGGSNYGIAVWTRRQALQHLTAGASDAGGETPAGGGAARGEVRYGVSGEEEAEVGSLAPQWIRTYNPPVNSQGQDDSNSERD